MNQSNPYESPQGEVAPESTEWINKLGPQEQPNRVYYGALCCFWSILVFVIFVFGSRMMVVFNRDGTLVPYYTQLIRWCDWISMGLELVGLFLLSSIGKQTGSKMFFRIAFVCLLLTFSWYLIHLLQTEVQEIPPVVGYFVRMIELGTQLFVCLALRRVSQFVQDRQMLRWSFWALSLTVIIFILNAGIRALYLFDLPQITNVPIGYREYSLTIGGWLPSVHGFLTLPILYCQPRLLWRLASWWQQVPRTEAAINSTMN